MGVLKAIGVAFISGLITVLIFFSGVVASAISVVVSTLVTIGLVFVGVFLVIYASVSKPDHDEDKR